MDSYKEETTNKSDFATIMFTLKEKVGALADALKVFQVGERDKKKYPITQVLVIETLFIGE